MNRVQLLGNITKDLELRQTSNSKSVTSFSIGVTRQYSNPDGNRESDFFNIVVWGKQAENCCKYLSKGSKVAITGTLQNRSYDDKNGQKRYVTEVVADNVEFLSTKKDSESGSDDMGSLPEVEEDLPF